MTSYQDVVPKNNYELQGFCSRSWALINFSGYLQFILYEQRLTLSFQTRTLHHLSSYFLPQYCIQASITLYRVNHLLKASRSGERAPNYINHTLPSMWNPSSIPCKWDQKLSKLLSSFSSSGLQKGSCRRSYKWFSGQERPNVWMEDTTQIS